MPLVSVLLPAKDAEATVDAAVASVLSQSLTDLELVAVDDGSTDGTRARLERWAERDGRVRVLASPGRGLVRALNFGLAHCRGRYVARMDADDESPPKRLEKSVAALERDRALAAVGTGVEIFRDDRPVSPNMVAYGRWLGSLTTPELLFRDRFVESPLCHPSATLRAEALARVGGYQDGDFPEDWALWLELLDAGFKLVNLPEVLFRWRDHDRRLTRSDARYSWESLVKLKARYLARVVKDRCIVWGAGELGLALTRALKSHGISIERLVEVSPKKIGQRIHGAPVVSPEAMGEPDGVHLVAAVGAKGAREQIRQFLTERGWTEGRDFTCAG